MFRLPGASNQGGIHRFLFQIAAHYKERKNAVEFLTDLLKVENPELFAVCLTKESLKDEAAVHKFTQELQNFIIQNHLKHKLLSQMKEILVRNVSDQSCYQFIYVFIPF